MITHTCMGPSRSPMCRGIGLVRSRITLPSLAWVFSRCDISLSTSSHDMLDTDANHCSYSRSRSCQNVAMSFLLFLAQLRCTWQQGLHIHALSARFGQHTSLSTSHSARLTQHASLSTSHSARLTQHVSLSTPHSARLTQHASLSTPRSSSSHLHSTRIARFAWQSTARLQPSCLSRVSECQSVRVRSSSPLLDPLLSSSSRAGSLFPFLSSLFFSSSTLTRAARHWIVAHRGSSQGERGNR
jgi:hypothetical protein